MKNNSANVLLIEDDVALGSSTMELLAALGYSPKLADSAVTAFELLVEPHDVDIVLLDLQLGRDRGENVVLRLRQTGAELPPIIILSALPTKTLAHAAGITRASGILQKPYSAAQLVVAIEHALS